MNLSHHIWPLLITLATVAACGFHPSDQFSAAPPSAAKAVALDAQSLEHFIRTECDEWTHREWARARHSEDVRECSERVGPGMAADCVMGIPSVSWRQNVQGAGTLWIKMSWIRADRTTCTIGIDERHGAVLQTVAADLAAINGGQSPAGGNSQTEGAERVYPMRDRAPLIVRHGLISRSDDDESMQGYEFIYFPIRPSSN